MSSVTDAITLIYRDAAGREIRLVCPWGGHSGDIPPPIIAFSTGEFVYQESRLRTNSLLPRAKDEDCPGGYADCEHGMSNNVNAVRKGRRWKRQRGKR